MTVSEHVYTAFLIGSPDVKLSCLGGSITLDESTAPHVQASLDIAFPGAWSIDPVHGGPMWTPDAASLAALDGRVNARVRVEVAADFPTGSQSRSFNLGLRDREVVHRDGVLRLRLAGDEGLLSDYAPLADDATPLTYQSSLRAVVNYVLGKAIPGAALQASPSNDADATTYGTTTNLITDPSNQGSGAIFNARNCTLDKNDTGWAAHGTKCINIYNPSVADANIMVGPQTSGVRAFGVSPGKTYVFSATGRVKPGFPVSGTPDARALELAVFDEYGLIANSPKLSTTPGAATRVSVMFTAPERGTFYFRAYHGYPAGQVQWDAFRLSEYTGDPADTGYFDGSTTDTAGYDYAWAGPVNDSTSPRKALIDRSPTALLWKAGVSALEFLMPLVQAAGFRLVCNEARQWTLRNENYAAAGVLSIRHGVNLIEGTDTISRDSGLWFDARVTRYRWTDSAGARQERIDAFALNTPYTRLTTLDIDAAYPGPGRSEYAVRRAQGRGREITGSTVSDWTTNPEQSTVIVLENTPTQIGKTSRVVFDLNDDTMTVTLRTTDVGVGAINLLPGTINALSGTINGL